MPYFSADAIKKLAEEYKTVEPRYQKLFMAYVQRSFQDEIAKEFATSGFPRRLNIMVRCIQEVFALLPPESDNIPSAQTRVGATINIQAFVFNVYGALDNLAWIWVQEKRIRRGRKGKLKKIWVGILPSNQIVRASFSDAFNKYLKSLDPWFDQLSDFRNSLAHRIPLYIPPYVIVKSDEPAYREFERLKIEAIKKGNFEEYGRISEEQIKLAKFRPWMQHSFNEKSKTIVFHPQLLADFRIVEELGSKMLEELDGKHQTPPPPIPSTRTN